MKRASAIISALMVLFVLLSGCSLLSGKSFDKKMGNNREAARTAEAWQQMNTEDGVPQKWYVELKPARGGEVRGDNLTKYRKKVTSVSVEIELLGKSVSKWKNAIELKKKMPNPYLSWPDGWLEKTAKQLASVENAKARKTPHSYPNADVTVSLVVNDKVAAIARYNRSTKTSGVEIHY